MVVILKDGTSESNIVDIVEYLDAYNVSVSVTKGEHTTILGLVGDTTSVDQGALQGSKQEIPSGAYSSRCKRNKNRRRQFPGHRRTLLS